MAANLIDLARGYLTSEVVRRISGELGESPDRVEKAIDTGRAIREETAVATGGFPTEPSRPPRKRHTEEGDQASSARGELESVHATSLPGFA